jgi:nuclear pore complex protein Nup93
MESTNLIPLDGDVGKITKRAEEFKDLHEALQRNLQIYLTLTMDIIAGIHQRVKAAGAGDTARAMVGGFVEYDMMDDADQRLLQTINSLRQKSRSLIMFAGGLKYRMAPDVYSYLARLDVEICL